MANTEEIQHTPGPWRVGNNYGAVVCDTPIPEIGGTEHTEHYGGYLVAESIAPKNRPIIAAAPEMRDSLSHVTSLLAEIHSKFRPQIMSDKSQIIYEAISKAEAILKKARYIQP